MERINTTNSNGHNGHKKTAVLDKELVKDLETFYTWDVCGS
jgi:membrane fusion protein (multidrug efflux system)